MEATNQMKITCVGHIAYDIIYQLDKFPSENTKVKTKKKIENGGGGAANMAYLLGKWKVDTTLIGRIGKDVYGSKIIEELKEASINTNYIIQDHQATDISTILTTNKTRTIIASTNHTYLQSLPNIETPDVFLLDGQEPILSKQLIKQFPNTIKILDPPNINEETISLAKKVDYMIAPLSFIQKLTNISINKKDKTQLETIYKQVKTDFPKPTIIITLEEEGAMYQENQQIIYIPTYSVKEQDTTGAGDIFHAAFAYYLISHHSLYECIEKANHAASYSVTQLGRKNATPTLEQLESFCHEFE